MSRTSKAGKALVSAAVILSVAYRLHAQPAPASEPPDPEQGLSREKPVNVCTVDGEQLYMQRLRCPDGSVPKFERAGSVGQRQEAADSEEEKLMLQQMLQGQPVEPGEKDFHMVDLWELSCPAKSYKVYLDMYHCPEVEAVAAPGDLKLGPPPAKKDKKDQKKGD